MPVKPYIISGSVFQNQGLKPINLCDGQDRHQPFRNKFSARRRIVPNSKQGQLAPHQGVYPRCIISDRQPCSLDPLIRHDNGYPNVYPNANISVLDGGAGPAGQDMRHGGTTTEIKFVSIPFSINVFTENNIGIMLLGSLLKKIFPTRHIHKAFSKKHSCLKSIEEADIVVSLSAGDRFSDINGLRRLLSVALPQVLVLLLGKPLVLLPQALGPFKTRVTRIIARYILTRARMIYSLDYESLTEVRGDLGVHQDRLAFGYDMGFALEPHIQDKQIPPWFNDHDRNTSLIGLNISGLLCTNDWAGRNGIFSLKVDYRQLIYSLIEHFVLTYDAEVVFVPYVFGTAANGECDVMAGRSIFRGVKHKLYSHLHFIDGAFDQHEMKALIGRCDFFIGSRIQACVAALSQCIPALGLAYSRGFYGVLASLGMEDSAIDIQAYDERSVIERVDCQYRRREELRAQLESEMPKVRASVMDLFTRINIAPGMQ